MFCFFHLLTSNQPISKSEVSGDMQWQPQEGATDQASCLAGSSALSSWKAPIIVDSIRRSFIGSSWSIQGEKKVKTATKRLKTFALATCAQYPCIVKLQQYIMFKFKVLFKNSKYLTSCIYVAASLTTSCRCLWLAKMKQYLHLRPPLQLLLDFWSMEYYILEYVEENFLANDIKIVLERYFQKHLSFDKKKTR